MFKTYSQFFALLATAAVSLPASLAVSAPAQAAPYVKVCGSGAQAGSGSCPANPSQGTGPNLWACTLDTATNLLWELKTPMIPNQPWNTRFYTNYDSTSSPQKGPNSFPTQAEIDATTNSIGYANSVNANTLCGKSTWQRPTKAELRSIVKGTTSVTIDSAYFPNTDTFGFYLTSTPMPGSDISVSMINFSDAKDTSWNRNLALHSLLRLVANATATLPDCGVNTTQSGQQCYGYLIQEKNAYPGHYQSSYSFSALPGNYNPPIPRCLNPAPTLNPGQTKCMRKYIWIKPTPPQTMNGSPQVFPPN
jgi:Protein of unknown function (DUF1566)